MSCRRRVCFFAHLPDELRQPASEQQQQQQVQMQVQQVQLLPAGLHGAHLVPGPSAVLMQPVGHAAMGAQQQQQQAVYSIQHQQPMLLAHPVKPGQPGQGQQHVMLQPLQLQQQQQLPAGSYTLLPAAAPAANRRGRVMMPMRFTARGSPRAAPAAAAARPLAPQVVLLQPGQQLAYSTRVLQQAPQYAPAPLAVQYIQHPQALYQESGGEWERYEEGYQDYAAGEPQLPPPGPPHHPQSPPCPPLRRGVRGWTQATLLWPQANSWAAAWVWAPAQARRLSDAQG
jgi:hypothetical protein